ncbi:MAG: hypothetical protein FJ278_24680 [Planctomycetes bacterium]|nr:hypothetical protein [Planctomycetota bacterium]
MDFMVTIRVPLQDLAALRSLRKGRLNPIADEHFRERIAEFFRRYPYDEWYPLDQREFAEDGYRESSCPSIGRWWTHEETRFLRENGFLAVRCLPNKPPRTAAGART